tara:strand:+ start:334 stop:1134 length:801 start_codon:yes stop_codon:yes gene_type:complete
MKRVYPNTLGSKRIDIVIQGGIWPTTGRTVETYLQLPFVNNVIVSTWEHEFEKIDFKASKFVYSTPPEKDGGGNLNHQIISSHNGLKECETDVVIKMRSDQTIPIEEMIRMKKFYEENIKGNEVFVLGLMGLEFPSHPYHPQDHVFWGDTEQVKEIFDIPLSNWTTYLADGREDFSKNIRSPMYLGVHKYARISEITKRHLEDPSEYLLDNAPKRNEAFEEYSKIKDQCFKSFPPINMIWHKYGGQNYPYSFYYEQGERYAVWTRR